MPAFAQEQLYTIDDIYSLPDGERAELIDGQIYYMAPPVRKHQEILSFLHATIYNYITQNKGGCKVYPAPFAVFLFADDTKYLEPDISVICNNCFPRQQADGLLYKIIPIPLCWCKGILDCGSNETNSPCL